MEDLPVELNAVLQLLVVALDGVLLLLQQPVALLRLAIQHAHLRPPVLDRCLYKIRSENVRESVGKSFNCR